MKNKRNRTGVTLTELMIAVAIFSLVMLAITPMFTLGVRQSASIEAHSSLKLESQNTMAAIARKLEQSKRLFENNANDNAFLARVVLSTAPAAISGSKLPNFEEAGGLSPSTSTFVAASVGNRLFFTSLDSYEDMTVPNASAVNRTVRIDCYRFNYYYLGSASGAIGGKYCRNLWQWLSIRYGDYIQLTAITDATQRTNAAAALYARGLRYVWDTSSTNASAAFYSINAAGAITLQAAHTISMADSSAMIKPLVGQMSRGYKYGVSPNTDASFVIGRNVPELGVASGDFPSGFEVVVVGPTSARNVMMRLVLVAQGAFKGIMSQEDMIVVTARDVW